MGNFIDLTGQKFGRLTVIERAENRGNQTMWFCRCECGNAKVIAGNALKGGATVSCGCYQKEMTSKKHKTHGGTGTRLHRIWQNMKARCYRKSAREYENYGGRGITVCKEWLHSFQAFYDWAMENGYADNLTIDRIKNDGNYCPENCRWITNKEQQNNRRDNVVYEFNGQSKNLSEWSEELGICYKTLQKRIREWGIEKAFTTPLRTERVIDITGKHFGRLMVLSLESTKGGAKFKCLCDCGNITIAKEYDIRNGVVKSCGCWNRERASERYKDVVRAKVEKADNKIVRCYTKDGEFIAEYKGVKNASVAVGISKNSIWRALRNENYTAKGMKWKYAEESEKM